MNKFQDVCLRATRSRSGSLTFHLAPDILRPLQPGDPVTLVTPPHTDQCDYCMRKWNKTTTPNSNKSSQQSNFYYSKTRGTRLRLMTGIVAPYLFLFTIYEGGAPSKVFTKFYIKLVTHRYI